MSKPDHREQWKHFVAGCTAGLASVLCLHPLDVIKTRLQVQDGVSNSLPQYRGTLHAGRSIVAEEGWRALYSGLSPALLGAGLSWGIYFFAYNRAKDRYQRVLKQQKLGPRTHLLAAAEAGSVVCCLTNPVWVVKTRLQLQRTALHSTATQLRRPSIGAYRGFTHAVKQIAREEGIRGFYKGLLPSLLLVSHGAIQMVVYEELKSLTARHRSWLSPSHQPSSTEITLMGAISKLAASVTTYPSQVVRSRLQQRTVGLGRVQYRGVVDAVKQTLQREGVGGLYKGIVPNVLRVMPQSAITFLVYEKVMERLQRA